MKQLTILVIIIMFSNIVNAAECKTELSHFFKDSKGCFLLYNLTKNKYEIKYGGASCERSLSPASTFKIPNSLIGLDLGILKDENSTYKWDGSKQFRPSWEHDQTLESAVKESVVWYFQDLAAEVGEKNYTKYLKDFDYGNRDISARLTKFWLSSSLKITPEEQVDFIKKLYKNELPVSSHSSETVKKILVLESDANKVLSGKTGSASVDGINIGWFVGHLRSDGTEYVFATNMTQKGGDYKINNEYSGLAAKAVTKEILSYQKLFK